MGFPPNDFAVTATSRQIHWVPTNRVAQIYLRLLVTTFTLQLLSDSVCKVVIRDSTQKLHPVVQNRPHCAEYLILVHKLFVTWFGLVCITSDDLAAPKNERKISTGD